MNKMSRVKMGFLGQRTHLSIYGHVCKKWRLVIGQERQQQHHIRWVPNRTHHL